MKKCILWDLISPINGVSSNEILEKDYIKKILNREDEIVLYGDDVITEQILSGSSIRYECRLSQDIPIGVAMQKFCELKQQQEIETLSLEEATKKISILEAENKALNTKVDTVKYTHSDLILDMDFRIMDIEDNLGIVPMKINLLNRIGDNDMNSTFMLVLDKIEMGNYKNKEEIESICDRYLVRNRITEEEYDTLMKALDKKEAEKNSIGA